MHKTSNDNTGNPSTDDSIIDYLSKKNVTDQTEKLALARISSKIGVSPQEAETSINRLSAKNLIRKVYVQGKVGFELTPRGKSAIAALAKAETERITKQLQEAIHEERKAKLRLSAVKKLKAVEEKWQNYPIPDRRLMGEIEQNAANFLALTKEIQAKQPLCNVNPESYDQEYAKYKLQVEKLAEQNIGFVKAVNNYAQIKDYQQLISADLDVISKAIQRYELVAEATAQVNQLRICVSTLRAVQSGLESFGKEQLSRLEQLKIQLIENSKLLETLKKPTHEFASTKRESLPEKATQYPDPECPIKYDDKTSGHQIVEKCGKCGAKRKSTPFNIG